MSAPSVAVYSALPLPAFSAFPSVTCLQWTADGQLLFLSKGSIIVLTPTHGINTDTSAAAKAWPTKGNVVTRPLAWLKTVIEQDKRALYHHWPGDSQEWATVSLGSLDLSLRAVTSSPSLTAMPGKGCVVATITSNLQLSLWTALKDHHKGQWMMLLEATDFLKSIAAEATDSSVERTLRAQVGCCSWSPQVDFGLDPAPMCDGSVLALGARAGTVVFLRLANAVDTPLTHLSSVRLSQQWITHVAWSPWSLVENNKCQAMVACGAADGSVQLLHVVQSLNVEEGQAIGQKFSIGWETGAASLAHEADHKTIIGLKWILPPEKPPILVHSKPGLIYLWSPAYSDQPNWEYAFRLQTQKTSASASFLRPVSGAAYVEKYDALVLSLYDGTFHAIYNVSGHPTLFPPSDAHPTSASVSATARTIFVRAEDRPVRKTEMCSINGMQPYDGGQAFVWVHEVTCPSDFSYKYDAQHSSNIVVADLWYEDDDAAMRCIESVLARSKPSAGLSPLNILRSIFFKLLHKEKLGALFTSILDVLRVADDAEVQELACKSVHALSDSLPDEIRKSLGRHLLGSQQLFTLRLRLSLADFCWKHAPDPQSQAECGIVAQSILRSISRSVLRVFIDHLSAISDVLTSEDFLFMLRVVVQCLQPEMPPSLSAAAQALSARTLTRIRSGQAEESSALPTTDLEEMCPACGLAVPLNDLTQATCPNGHAWQRCSVTSFILATPMVRTCVGCKRKAFLPPTRYASPGTTSVASEDGDDATDVAHLPSAARSWVVVELLLAVSRCLFCGNNFTSMI